ncbi:hypothetical protein O3M35_000306 [Rhynocoris fuscipes]|uniref:Fe2OG dioxygenase domain-containing protein n=1 Tax=Rhynocoris fuscipes TaxID=488301 RepID=A0AAW1DL72_9HEMI
MFKVLFKQYKSKCSPVSLDNVIKPEDLPDGVQIKQPSSLNESEVAFEKLGLIPPTEWKIFQITSQSGLLFVKNPFTWEGQRFWINKCIVEYPQQPNKTNLDAHGLLCPGENWWKICQTDDFRKKILLKKLRWITLGYHHNWDTKVYSEQSKTKMPEELVSLGKLCAKVTGGWDLTPEAAIINFYHFGSTLSGHIDHSEPNVEAPIFSFSFGGRAIFLIENSNNTSAILLESGDLVIMSGQSRLAMHGVPRIMEPLHPYPWNPLDSLNQEIDDWDPSINDYVTSARININLRQVLKPGHSTLG